MTASIPCEGGTVEGEEDGGDEIEIGIENERNVSGGEKENEGHLFCACCRPHVLCCGGHEGCSDHLYHFLKVILISFWS